MASTTNAAGDPSGRLAMRQLGPLAAAEAWNSEMMNAVTARGRASFAGVMNPRTAMSIMAPSTTDLVRGIDMTTVIEHDAAFGPRWSGHPLLQATEPDGHYYSIIETQIGKGLAACLSARPDRAASLLVVMADLSGRNDLIPLIAAPGSFRVTAEAPLRQHTRAARADHSGHTEIERQRRIDLLIEWTADAAPKAVVAIELKLHSRASRGQLRAYGDHARQLARGMKPGLFLLTLKPDPAEKRHSSWCALRWLAVLRRWERRLAQAGDDDVQFAIFRSQLWDWALTKRN